MDRSRKRRRILGRECQVEGDGTFVSGPLAPGDYVLDASAEAGDDRAGPSTSGFAPVAVKKGNVSGVVVTLHPSATVQGRVRFESERDAPPLHPRVTIRAVLAVERMRDNHSVVAVAAEDETFTLAALHGPRLIRADAERGSSPAPWWLKSVLLDGEDVTNVPIDFSAKPSARLEVIFSDRPTAVVGIVHDEAGLPVESARVVLFSKDPSMWAAWSTAVQAGVSDENGRFWFVDAMPAGDYRAIALRDGAPPSIAEAVDELPRLEKLATPIGSARARSRGSRSSSAGRDKSAAAVLRCAGQMEAQASAWASHQIELLECFQQSSGAMASW